MKRTLAWRHPRQRGAATIEYVFLVAFGLVPLLLLTFTGVMIFAAKQSLTLAAEEGARAAMRQPAIVGGQNAMAVRQANACAVASVNMKWLLNFSSPAVTRCNTRLLEGGDCGLAGARCISVETTYNYDMAPFFPGTGALYRWTLGEPIRSTAVAQLDTDV